MKLSRNGLIVGIVFCASLAFGQSMTFERTFKVGDTTVYDINTQMQTMVPITMDMKIIYNITKVYPDGSADQLTTIKSGSVTVMGRSHPLPMQSQAKSVHVDKFGIPISASTSPQLNRSERIIDLQLEHGLTVGKPRKFATTDSATKTDKYSGTLTLTDITKGIAHVTFDVVIKVDKLSSTPIHSAGVMNIDAKTHETLSETSDIEGLTLRGQSIKSVHTVMKKI